MEGCSAHASNDSLDFGSPPDEEEMNLSQTPYYGELRHVPAWELGIKVSITTVIMAASLIGNTLVVVVVARNKRMWTPTNFYILNLAVADLFVTCFCTWVHLVDNLTEGWVLGQFFCKVNSFIQVLVLVCSSLTLTMISCDRFFGIVFALKAHLSERRAGAFIALIWVLAAVVASPLLVYRKQHVHHWLNHTEIWCGQDWPKHLSCDVGTGQVVVTDRAKAAYNTFVSVVLFFLPITVMSVTYSLIIVRLRASRCPGERFGSELTSQEKLKRKVVLMLVFLMVVFSISWLPLQVSLLYIEFRNNKLASLPNWYFGFKYFATLLAYTNSAINPVIYAGFNENFRKGLFNLLGLRCLQKRPGSTLFLKPDSSFRSSTVFSRVRSPEMLEDKC